MQKNQKNRKSRFWENCVTNQSTNQLLPTTPILYELADAGPKRKKQTNEKKGKSRMLIKADLRSQYSKNDDCTTNCT